MSERMSHLIIGGVDLEVWDSVARNGIGAPATASTVAAMTDTTKVYVYTGSEAGYTAGNWYYYNGSAWVSGGVYNSTAFETDDTLSQEGMAADAKAAGDAISALEEAIGDVEMKAGVLYDSVSGDIVTIVPDRTVPNLLGCEADIEPVQDLHGYDAPWGAGAGKNILPYPYRSTATSNWTINDDGTVVFDGSTTSASYLWLYGSNSTPIPDWVKPNTQYAVSCGNGAFRTGNSYPQMQMLFYGSPTVVIAENSGTTPADFSQYTGFAAVLYVPANTTLSNVKCYPQIEEGSTPTAYAPYSNICPISGHTEVNANRTGVNVWDEEWEAGTIDATTGQNDTSSAAWRSKHYIPVVPSTQYYFCTPTGTSNAEARGRFYDANKRFIGTLSQAGQSIKTNKAFTTPDNAYYMRFCPNNTSIPNHDVSINYPSTDNNYHPYNGDAFTIALGQTVYGGKLDVTKGKLTVTRGFVEYDGSDDENWVLGATGTYRQAFRGYLPSAKAAEAGSIIGMMTSCIPLSTTSENDNVGVTCRGTNYESSYLYVFAPLAEFSTVAGLKAYLANNPTQISYRLATTVEITLTPQEIAVLVGQNNIWADTGEIAVEYAADIKNYIDSKIAAAVAAMN